MAMGRRKKIILWVIGVAVVLAGTVVAAGPYVYRALVNEESVAAPSVDVSSVSSSSLDDLSGTWQASEGSYAGYRVKELLRGVDVTVVGRTEQVTGEFIASKSTVKSGKVTVDIASVATNISDRDQYFRDNTMHVAEYPNAIFAITSPVELPSPLKAGYKEIHEVKGKMTIHDVTREITTTLEVGFDGTDIQVAGNIPITFTDYDVVAPDLGFVRVEHKGAVELLIKFRRAD